jgi:hypothetical protein
MPKIAIQEELYHQQVDRDMSSKKGLDRELSLERREAILQLSRDGEMEEVEIGMLRGDGRVEAVSLKSVNSLKEICDISFTKSR